MKKIILIISLTLMNYSYLVSQTGWYWENPLPQGNELTSVYFTDNQTGFAVGVRGTILKTINSGINWSIIDSPTKQDLSKIKFINANLGYIVGDSGKILKTTNGGNNWTVNYIGYNIYLSSISFLNQNTGIISTYGGFAYKTTNAGISWQNYVISSSSTTFYDIQYIDSNNVYTICTYYFFKSTNGGINWTSSSSFSQLYSMYFINSQSGYIVGDFGQIFESSDAGNTWYSQSMSSNFVFHSIQFLDNYTGFICGYNNTLYKGIIYKTTNFGNNWISQLTDSTFTLNSLYFVNSNFGCSVGISGKIFVTSNSGLNWNVESSGKTTNLNKIQFIDSLTGYIAGSKQLWKTTNGGNQWDVIYNFLYGFNDLNFLNPQLGMVTSNRNLGTNPVIMVTSDGGLTWQNRPPSTATDYYGIYMITDSLCVSVGNAGTIVRTTNFGLNWVTINSGNTHDLRAVYFTTHDTGYICGAGGIILKSTDAGNDWVIQYNLGASPHFYGMSFINSSTGYVVGSSPGLIVKTTNGGTNWFNLTTGYVSDLRNISVIDTNGILAIGNNGNIIFSNNSGNNWITLNLTRNNLLGISCLNKNNIHIVGSYGTILTNRTGIITNLQKESYSIEPKSFSLFQNYPNPFNSRTNIK